MEIQPQDNLTKEEKIKQIEEEIAEYRRQIAERDKERNFRGEIRNNFMNIFKKIAVFLIGGAFVLAFLGEQLFSNISEEISKETQLTSGISISIIFYFLVFVVVMLIAIGKSSGDSYSKWKIQRLCLLLFLVLIIAAVFICKSVLLGGV